MTGFVSDFSRVPDLSLGDRRFRAPSFDRNNQPIGDCLETYLGQIEGNVIEIGSGPGQHVTAFARRFGHLTWWPTDPLAVHLESIVEWTRVEGVDNVRPPTPLDAAAPDWRLGEPDRPPADDVAAILAINVLHITPFAVAEGMFAAAGRTLVPGGILALYGPFTVGGEHTSPSNAEFDASLRASDREWGVRDMDDLDRLASAAGLVPAERATMPANNFTLVYGAGGNR